MPEHPPTSPILFCSSPRTVELGAIFTQILWLLKCGDPQACSSLLNPPAVVPRV